MDIFKNSQSNFLKAIIFSATIFSLSGCIDLSGGKILTEGKSKIKAPTETNSPKANKMTKSKPAPVQAKKEEKKFYGEIHALRGGLGIFSLAMNKLQAIVSERYDVPGSSTMWYSAGEVSTNIINYRYKHNTKRPIILIGHSLGANEQIKVARNLDKAGIPVDLLITLDPVLPPMIPPNVKYALNIYQPGMVPMFSGIRLRAVNPEKTKINNMNIDHMKGVSINHFTIANNLKIQEIVLNEVDKVLTDANRKRA
ncbi:MAG: hypothetical protein EPN84_11330 [Legionella sp.]|nr:MAG: hypothetical protein EPN84_11330 [Legionella sp.]